MKTYRNYSRGEKGSRIEDTMATDGTNIYHEHTIDYIKEYENAEEDLLEETDDDPSVNPEPTEEVLISDGSQSSGYLPSPQKRKKKSKGHHFVSGLWENETIGLQYSSLYGATYTSSTISTPSNTER